jgi:anti-sigma-K factor RskA
VNIQEYIESGILEAYILGALSPDEEALVEANIVKFPELELELLAIEDAMNQFTETLATTPPGGTQDKIWAAIQQTKPASHDGEVKKSKTIPFVPPVQKTEKSDWRYAAAIIALTGSVFMNVLLWKQNNDTKQKGLALQTQVDTLQNRQSQLSQLVTNFNKEKSMMADTGMQTIVMHTIQPGHPMAATVYWSKKEGVAYVAVDALPAPPSGMQYQLWVMQDGKPVDMGVISNDITNTPILQKVPKTVTAGQAFAISLEKAGGSPTPTMTAIYVMGAAS